MLINYLVLSLIYLIIYSNLHFYAIFEEEIVDGEGELASDGADLQEGFEDFKNEPRVVIAGDFNTLKWHPPAKKGGNPWETGNPEEFQVFVKSGYRLAQSGEVKTAPTHGPKLAIDNVIVRGFRMSDVSFPDCGRLSDHLPVCCTLTEE